MDELKLTNSSHKTPDKKSPLWLCIVFPPAAVWGKGWAALLWTTLLFLYGWAPAIPAALYYNS